MIETSADHWLSRAAALLPAAAAAARSTTSFSGRWSSIASKLDLLPPTLSDLSTHPCFSKTPLSLELLQSLSSALSHAIGLAARCRSDDHHAFGKLQTQSDLDALSARLDLALRDCRMLIKTGVLAGAAAAPSDVPELLARIQIGDADAKNSAIDGLLEAVRDGDNGAGAIAAAMGRTSASAIAQLLSSSAAPKMREKAAAVICSLAEIGACQGLLVAEGVVPGLIRLAESGTAAAREKAVVSLQKLSTNADAARVISANGGITSMIEICESHDSINQSSAIATLKNLSAVPEITETLTDSRAIRAIIRLLDNAVVSEQAAECLQNLTAGSESIKSSVIAEGGLRRLLAYLDGPTPQEPSVAGIKNLIDLVPLENIISLGLIPRLGHVLKVGPLGAKEAAAAAVCKISSSPDSKKLVGELGIVPLLVALLEAKSNSAREVAAQAIASLMAQQQNRREVKRDERSVPSLVQLLDWNSQNTAKKYAVACLLCLASSKKRRRVMISHGAIGYLKKLKEMDVNGAKELLERLERARPKNSLFS